jgi:hypothetical protein
MLRRKNCIGKDSIVPSKFKGIVLNVSDGCIHEVVVIE